MPIYDRDKLHQLLHVDEREKIFLPNSIFDELKGALLNHPKNKSSKHIPFAYAYVYLTSYLWRYAKFGLLDGTYDYTEDELKRLLTVSGNNKELNYITKRNGVLQELRYIRKVSDWPIVWSYGNSVHNWDNDGSLELTMLSTLKDTWVPAMGDKSTRNRKVNFPVRGHFELPEDEEENYESGYLIYVGEINNEKIKGSHVVDIETFLHCMSIDDLGLEAFYIYHFISWKSQMFEYWNCPQAELPCEMGIKIDTIKDKLKVLEQYNMITNSHEMFITALPSDKKMKANEYSVNDSVRFKESKKEISKREVLHYDLAVSRYGDEIFLSMDDFKKDESEFGNVEN